MTDNSGKSELDAGDKLCLEVGRMVLRALFVDGEITFKELNLCAERSPFGTSTRFMCRLDTHYGVRMASKKSTEDSLKGALLKVVDLKKL